MIERKQYLEQLIDKKENGMVKVITGIRRCGKSVLLFEIYRQYLLSVGVAEEQIIELALDDDENAMYRDPVRLGEYVRGKMTDRDTMYYIFLDEIQKVSTIQNPYVDDPEQKIGFVDVVNFAGAETRCAYIRSPSVSFIMRMRAISGRRGRNITSMEGCRLFCG